MFCVLMFYYNLILKIYLTIHLSSVAFNESLASAKFYYASERIYLRALNSPSLVVISVYVLGIMLFFNSSTFFYSSDSIFFYPFD